MTALANGLLLYAVDPEPTHGEIIFDFVAGQIVPAIQLEVALTTATAEVALANVTANAAGTFTEATAPAPEPPLVPSLPMPRTGGTGRTVRLQLTANLGRLTAQTSPRVELADEELIEIL